MFLYLIIFSLSVFNTKGLGKICASNLSFLSLSMDSSVKIGIEFKGELIRTFEKGNKRDNYLFQPTSGYFYLPIMNVASISAGLERRFDMNFDVASDTITTEHYKIVKRVKSSGGINSLFLGGVLNFGVLRLGGGGEYLFGAVHEVWEVYMREEELSLDSMFYRFDKGFVPFLAGGIQLRDYGIFLNYSLPQKARVISVSKLYEDTTSSDTTTFPIPFHFEALLQRNKWEARIFYLRDNSLRAMDRIGIFAGKEWRIRKNIKGFFRGSYHRWYYLYPKENIQEYSLENKFDLLIKGIGEFGIGLELGFRHSLGVKEFFGAMEVCLEFSEVWRKRKRLWGGF